MTETPINPRRRAVAGIFRLQAARVAAPLAALLVVGFVVMGVSRAAFFDTTTNDANQFAAGTVVLVDDDSGSAMFNVSGMAGGDTATGCIAVTYNGSITPADVVLYVAPGGLTGTGLDDYLNLTVERGTGGSFGDCTGFSGSSIYSGTLDGFAAASTDFASGAGLWTASSTGDSRVYRFTLTLQDDNAAQGLTATTTFTWEAQNQ
jgi:hypothetical protein